LPQSRLPDVNTAIIVYRREAITDLKGNKYDACLGALHALNGMLPKEYRVTISTMDYNAMMKEGLFATCKFCTQESDFRTVKPFELVLPFVNSVIATQAKEKIWLCSHCQKENRTGETMFTNKIFKKPYYLRVVPDPPTRKDGMMGRTQFTIKFSSWFWLALSSIEAQMGRYREEYQPKDSDMFDMEASVQEGGEIQ